MLLRKLRQNRDSLMEVGAEARELGREAGLKPSFAQRDPDRIIDHDKSHDEAPTS